MKSRIQAKEWRDPGRCGLFPEDIVQEFAECGLPGADQEKP